MATRSVSWMTSSGFSEIAARKPVASSVRLTSADQFSFVSATWTRARLRMGGSSWASLSSASESASSVARSDGADERILKTNRWLSCAPSSTAEPCGALEPACTSSRVERAPLEKLATSRRQRSCSPNAVREALTMAKLSSGEPNACHSSRWPVIFPPSGLWSVRTKMFACCLPSSAASGMAESIAASGDQHCHCDNNASTSRQLFVVEPSERISVPARINRVDGGG